MIFQTFTAKRREVCGSDSSDNSRTGWEALLAVVQYVGYFPGEKSGAGHADGEQGLCAGA